MGGVEKVMVIQEKNAHLDPLSDENGSIQLTVDVAGEPVQCGRFSFWPYGVRTAAFALDYVPQRRGRCGCVFGEMRSAR